MKQVSLLSSRLLVVMLATSAAASSTSTLKSLLGTDLVAGVVWKSVNRSSGMQESLREKSIEDNSNRNVGFPRTKRQLIDFPDDAIMEFDFKLVVPYWTYPRVRTRGDYRLEVTYELPNQLLRRRKRRSLVNERSALYNIFGDFLSKAGLDGDMCVLRAVCEVGESPMDEYGVFGEFINLVFAPGFQASVLHKDHIQAEEYGRSYGNCWSAFPDCPISLRELLQEFFLNSVQAPIEGWA
ncbi:uncharacterized protein [Panulirus ornatus]